MSARVVWKYSPTSVQKCSMSPGTSVIIDVLEKTSFITHHFLCRISAGSENERGRRRGVGQNLVKHARSVAMHHGVGNVSLCQASADVAQRSLTAQAQMPRKSVLGVFAHPHFCETLCRCLPQPPLASVAAEQEHAHPTGRGNLSNSLECRDRSSAGSSLRRAQRAMDGMASVSRRYE